ncbi:MAG: DUF4349 domain-containing protein [Lawsonibacter sp.]|nr:DUF4349 domain-containing protein [Lawsonibacter sp.]
MNVKRFLAIWMTVLLLLAAGCSAGAKTSSSPSYGAESNTGTSGRMDYGEMEKAEDSLPMTQTGGSQSESSVYQNAGAKLIRRAELAIQTTRFDQAAKTLDGLVLSHDGYYESASVNGGSYRDVNANRSGEYVIRIPAEQFRAFQSSVGGLGYVTSSTESSEDVGEQYYDTEARLKTQQTKQERLLSLLEKADTMEDIISLENALSDVEYQIEQLSSALNRYNALISYSTFHISLNEVAKVTEEVGETASLSAKMSAGLLASVEGLVRGFQNFMIWISYHIFAVLILLAMAGGGTAVVLRNRTLFRKKEPDQADKEKEESQHHTD